MSNENLIKQLKGVGLKQNESEIYLFLLQNGLSTPPVISKGTNIARTNCYNILKSLKEKDVVAEQNKGKKKVYIARDPKFLKLDLEKKIESLERLVPDLEVMQTTQKNKPKFIFFDGWKEVREIYSQSLTAREIYATGSTEKLVEIESGFFEKYIKEVEKRKIHFYDLLKEGENSQSVDIIKNLGGELYSVNYLPKDHKGTITDILVWEDNLALISLEEPVFGTMIKNGPLADTLRTILSLLRATLGQN